MIGNPIHDLVRLGLSLASAARGSDLPGVTTARILEQIIEGYAGAMEPGQTGEEGDDIPEAMRVAVKTARRRSWHHLAKERIENIKPTIPMGKRFWPLATDERSECARVCSKRTMFASSLPCCALAKTMHPWTSLMPPTGKKDAVR